MKALIDGRPGALLAADDRGLLYGETVFETLAFNDGRAPLWDRHMARLERGAGLLAMRAPTTELLLEECRQIAPQRGPAVLRITLTAGSGGRGYWPAECPQPRRIIHARPWPPGLDRQRHEGLRLVTSAHVIRNADFGLGLKHGNRLVQVAAARECTAARGDEALLLDEQGCVVEAISSNVVLVRDGQLLTHPRPAVAGVGLGWLREQPGVNVADGRVPATDLLRCSEILVINSVAGIRPAITLDGQHIGPGPVGRRLQSLWNQHLP